MIFDRNEQKAVVVLLGAGSMGTAIVRRIGAGKKILLGDISEKALERVGDVTVMDAQKNQTHLTLNNGIVIPQFGLGVYSIPAGEVTYNSVLTALKAGYRHIQIPNYHSRFIKSYFFEPRPIWAAWSMV